MVFATYLDQLRRSYKLLDFILKNLINQNLCLKFQKIFKIKFYL
jgi:hypothetical protein